MPDALTVTYYGHVFDASGYGEAARAYIHALHRAGVTLSVVDLMRHGRQVRDELVESLLDRPLQPDFHLFHGIPPQWARLAFPLPNAIGMTVWETDTMPTQWHNVLSHVVDVWLPCTFNVETFRRSLDRLPFRLPHPVVSRHVNGERSAIEALTAGPEDFVFYSIFEWQNRKGPHELLRAYLSAFSESDRTLLLLKVNPGAASVANAALDDARQHTKSTARVRVIADAWTPGHIEALHARGDCYVSLHHGEGWGYPLFDAAARGKPVVATAFSGPLDYLDNRARLVPFKLAPVNQPYVYYGSHMRWAAPDVDAAAQHMRAVHRDPDEARAAAAGLGERIRGSYSLDAVGRMAHARLLALLERVNARRSREIHGRARRAELDPARPIPAEWYDADYFEHGVTSNWSRGYGWDQVGGVFRDAASYLVEMFPEASTFLDVGCAKGFLVRCLRDAGKTCWGVDHSAWAIAHADASAKPFLIESGIDEFAFDRTVDVLVAFDVLSELTEEQAVSFLRRARSWTSGAILAVIPSFDSPEEEAAYRPNENRDRTHITMRTRAWWHERFIAAGWRQDSLQRLGAERCQSHALPRRMQWHVYAYGAR